MAVFETLFSQKWCLEIIMMKKHIKERFSNMGGFWYKDSIQRVVASFKQALFEYLIVLKFCFQRSCALRLQHAMIMIICYEILYFQCDRRSESIGIAAKHTKHTFFLHRMSHKWSMTCFGLRIWCLNEILLYF